MKKKKFYPYFIFLLVVMAIEVFIFNWRTWESLTFPQSKPGYQVLIDDKSFFDNPLFPEQDLQTLLIKNLNQNVQNININLKCTGSGCPTVTKLNISFNDNGRSIITPKGSHSYIQELPQTHFLRLHPYGNLGTLEITFNNPSNAKFELISVKINAFRPLSIQFLRILIVFLIFSIIYTFYSNRNFFIQYYTGNSNKRKKIILLTAAIHILLFTFVLSANPLFWKKINLPYQQEYHYLTEAFVNGQTHLLIEPSPELKDLSNPYDNSLRYQQQVNFLWDFAYFNGKYYVYFGVAPVLFFYLPFYLITGIHLPNPAVIWICEVLFILGVFLFIEELVCRYFKYKLPLGFSLFLSSATVFGSGAFFIARRPDIYSVPIIMALALIIWGWLLWLRSRRPDQTLNLKSLTLGSLCIALVAACRPQLILSAFAGFFFFASELKNLKYKQNLKYLTYALFPFFIIAIGLMLYNNTRFNSPFDFGANYNLTTNDMTNRGFIFDRFAMGINTYLFQLPNFQPIFPFINYVSFSTNYIGEITRESTTGGLLSCNPFLYISIPFLVSKLKNNKIIIFSFYCMLIGIIIMLIDIQCAGLLQRYTSDFALFIFIGSLLITFSYLTQLHNRELRTFLIVLILFMATLGLLYNFSLFFLPEGDGIILGNPKLYYQIISLFN